MIFALPKCLKKMLASLVQKVPEEKARCEFICRSETCTPEIFEHCEKRKEYLAAKRER